MGPHNGIYIKSIYASSTGAQRLRQVCGKFKFCFLELSGIPPSSLNIFDSGWLNPLMKTLQ